MYLCAVSRSQPSDSDSDSDSDRRHPNDEAPPRPAVGLSVRPFAGFLRYISAVIIDINSRLAAQTDKLTETARVRQALRENTG